MFAIFSIIAFASIIVATVVGTYFVERSLEEPEIVVEDKAIACDYVLSDADLAFLLRN